MPKQVSRLAALLAVLLVAALASARPPGDRTSVEPPSRVLVLDGSPVHDVGELHLHTTNWGAFGSWPNTGFPFSDAPSAEWPAGSGTEYLFGGGLWVGALKDGVPSVSTAAFEFEFRPTNDPIDIVYRTSEGAPGGNRLPSKNADDDADGQIDEDPLDGRDNDGDGKIDEDFAAISDQMFSRWYTDDQPGIENIYPNHRPLNLMVRENSYQWEHDDFDDFVGFDYEITNIGESLLQDVYIGVFLDPDIGQRDVQNYWEDDRTRFTTIFSLCSPEYGPLGPFEIAYAYDADGDNGAAHGYFGVAGPGCGESRDR